MTLDHFERALRAFTGRRPFQPFAVELFSGDRFMVRHPEALRLIEGVVMYTAPNRLHKLFDCGSVCQLCDIQPEGAV